VGLLDFFLRKKPVNTVFIGGHGLVLAPICPCYVSHLDNGSLCFADARNAAGPGAVVVPGTVPAIAGEPTVETKAGLMRFRYGHNGPVICPRRPDESLHSSFAYVEGGWGEAPWSVWCQGGFSVDLPRGFALWASAQRADHLLLPELHLVRGRSFRPLDDTFATFHLRPVAPETLEIGAPAGVEIVNDVRYPTELGPVVRLTEIEYEHEGEVWRRGYYVLPLASDDSVVLNAGARLRDVPKMRDGANEIARSFSPVD
jgi:hypothetical protein